MRVRRSRYFAISRKTSARQLSGEGTNDTTLHTQHAKAISYKRNAVFCLAISVTDAYNNRLLSCVGPFVSGFRARFFFWY